MTRHTLPLLLGLLALAALAGCGGDSEFSGEAKVPSGYKTYAKAGVSFAYPGDWTLDERTDADGLPSVDITPPDKSKTPYGLIRFSITPKAGDRFDSLADQRRVVVEEVNGGKIDSDESVDIPGADKALRSTATTPPDRGNDPVEVKADSLDVLRGNGDVLTLVVASPERGGQAFDPAKIVETFRLEDGS